MQDIRNREIKEKEFSNGFTVRRSPRAVRDTDQFMIMSLVHSRSKWNYQIWAYEGKKYLFLDLGFRNLDIDLHTLNSSVIYHVKNHPDRDLDVIFGPDRINDLQALIDMNENVQQAVLKMYQKKKPYLDQTDFHFLRSVNSSFVKNDSFILSPLEESSNPINLKALKTASENVLATIQAHYAGVGNVKIPTTQTLVNAIHPLIDEAGRGQDFPFQARVRGIFERDTINRLVRVAIDPVSSAEITRYMALKSVVPEPVKNRLILELFDTLIRRGIKTFLANLDEDTYRLFKSRYGFEKLMDLPIHQSKPELVAYLRTDSPQFLKTYKFLAESSSKVGVVKYVGVEREDGTEKR